MAIATVARGIRRSAQAVCRTDGMASPRQEFEQVFRAHAHFVYSTAYGITGRHEDAEDILQTLFLRLLRRERPLDFGGNPRAYLYRAAVNLALDAIKVRHRLVSTDAVPLLEIPAPAVEPMADNPHRLLYRAIGELSRPVAEMLVLRYVHDKSDAEIARMLGVSRVSIAIRLSRARARLRTLLRPANGGST
jgi:RNA polymerase sigma-70 factor, ECF subfamily